MSAPAAFSVEGLRTEQAPPLSIPASFVLVAPLAMLATGLLLAWDGPAAMSTRYHPFAFAAAHLGALGFLGAVMLGALYQMIPVVAGAPVPWPRLAHLVHVAWTLGTGALALGLVTGHAGALAFGASSLGVALVLFLGPIAVALARAPTRDDTVLGIALAVAGLGSLACFGALFACVRLGLPVPRVDLQAGLAAHAALGALVWVGGLVTAVSWQVVPMFYLADPPPRAARRAMLAAVALALVGAPAAALAGAGATAVVALAAPAALAVLAMNPALVARSVARRRRRRADPSLDFLRVGLAGAALVLALAVATLASDAPRLAPALGFVAVWGWAGMIAHGMLVRIVPFLVWFHRFSPLAGHVPVPSMRALLPDRRVRVAFALHVGAVVATTTGALLDVGPLVRLGGASLALAALALAANLVHTLGRRAPSLAPTSA